MNPVAMSIMLVSLHLVLVVSLSFRFKLLALAQPEPRFSIEDGKLGPRIRDFFVYLIGQKKMPYYAGAGIAHIAIFYGFLVLTINTLMLWGRGYDEHFNFFGLLALDNPIGAAYNISKDIVIVLVLIGAATFLYYRLVNVQKRMSLSGEALVILGIIITMMLADLAYAGANLVLANNAAGLPTVWHGAEPVGSIVAIMFSGLGDGPLTFLQQSGFWYHATMVLVFANILPYSKHFHIITIWMNVPARHDQYNKLPNIDDIEGRFEREEPIGYGTVEDLTWKDVLDLYTCTECGRCSDNCPAYTTDKKLSPKHLTMALRDHLYASQSYLVNKGTAAEFGDFDEDSVEKPELHHGDPPKDAYYAPDRPVQLVPSVVNPDVIWACTSCRACEEQCPVMISYVDKIVQMRRDAVMMKNEFPGELMNPFNGLETNGNPWNLASMDRADWADGLDVPLMSDNKDADVLYWVGCAASYDDRAKKVARSTVRLLKQAGVNFAILGTEETCTGDPARRAGNEYLFQTMAEQNVETLKGYEVEKKKIITTCPHCFNTLANEYPDFGGKYDVVHHSTYLEQLIAAKKLVPKKSVGGEVVYHDSCYLGRYNEVYDAPRNVLKSIPGVTVREPNYWNRNKGLCCGAGGAQMFMEEQNENRVNVKRTGQLLDTGAKTIATGCPFCMTMLTDGLKDKEKEDEIKQLDIAELLAHSVEFTDAAPEDKASESKADEA